MHALKFLTLLPAVRATIFLKGLNYEPFDVLSSVPYPWEELTGPLVPPETKVTLHMPLAHANLEAYERRMLTSHDPDDLDYGKYISLEELDLMLGPSNETFDTVIAWLRLFGIQENELTLVYDWLTFETTVGKAEALLKAKYGWYVNRMNGGQITLRCLGYSLPKEVRGMVRFVQPTTLFSTRVDGEGKKVSMSDF